MADTKRVHYHLDQAPLVVQRVADAGCPSAYQATGKAAEKFERPEPERTGLQPFPFQSLAVMGRRSMFDMRRLSLATALRVSEAH